MCGFLHVSTLHISVDGKPIERSHLHPLPGHPGYCFRIFPTQPGKVWQSEYRLSITREGEYEEVRAELIPLPSDHKGLRLPLCLDEPAFPVRPVWRRLCEAGVDPDIIEYTGERRVYAHDNYPRGSVHAHTDGNKKLRSPSRQEDAFEFWGGSWAVIRCNHTLEIVAIYLWSTAANANLDELFRQVARPTR